MHRVRASFLAAAFFFGAALCGAEEGVIPFRTGAGYGLLDGKLNVAIRPQYASCTVTGDGSYALFTDRAGKSVRIAGAGGNPSFSAPDATSAVPLTGPYFAMTESGKRGIRVLNAETARQAGSTAAASLIGAECTAQAPSPLFAGQGGFYNKNLKEAGSVPPDCAQALPMVGGAAVIVRRNGSFAVINRFGTVVLDGIADCGRNFCEGLLPVILRDGRSGYVGTDGNFAFRCPIVRSSARSAAKGLPTLDCYFSGGVAYVPVAKGTWRVYARKGAAVTAGKTLPYAPVGQGWYSGGVIAVSARAQDGSVACGYVDAAGAVVLPFVFGSAGAFSGGYAMVTYRGRDAILDRAGRVYFSDDLLSGKKAPVSVR